MSGENTSAGMNTEKTPQDNRDIQVITMEIKTLHRQAQQVILSYAIEIGRRLREAKEQLPHGKWGEWIKSEVEFSQSTANNFMRIFEEYGAGQISLFGGEAKSQALGNLSYTKALALLTIPEDEREAFAAEHEVDQMSTRELERLIRERDAAKADAEEKEKAWQAAELAKAMAMEEMEQAKQRLEQLVSEAAEAGEARGQLEAELTALRDAPITVDVGTIVDTQAVQDAVSKVESEARENLRQAKEREQKTKAKLDELKQALAAQKEEHKRALAKAAEEAAQKSDGNAQRLRALEQELALANPDAQTFQLLFEQVQIDFSKMIDSLRRMDAQQCEVAEKLKKAAVALADQFLKMASDLSIM